MMKSKSLEYIKQRISSGNVIDMDKEEFQNMRPVAFNEVFKITKKQPICINKDNQVCATLTYDPDADFNYFTLETCYCDGTLMFMFDLASRIINKIVNLQTCYSPIVEEFGEIDINKHIIHYTVGEFVINSYYTEYPDKPWMRDKFTVILPVKFEIEER